MTEIELKILVPLHEYKNLQKLAKEHENCNKKHAGENVEKFEESTTLKEGSGSGEQRQNLDIEPQTGPCQESQNIDQCVTTVPKQILLDSENPSIEKKQERKPILSVDSIISQIRPRYQKKGRKLLTTLLQNPEDFGYDKNGLVTIFKASIPGISLHLYISQ